MAREARHDIGIRHSLCHTCPLRSQSLNEATNSSSVLRRDLHGGSSSFSTNDSSVMRFSPLARRPDEVGAAAGESNIERDELRLYQAHDFVHASSALFALATIAAASSFTANRSRMGR